MVVCLEPLAALYALLGGAGGGGLGLAAGGHGAGYHLAGALPGALGGALGKQLELALLGYEAGGTKALDGLKASLVLCLGYNATLVSLH